MPFMMENHCFQHAASSILILLTSQNHSKNIYLPKDDSQIQETFLFSFLKAFMVLVKRVDKYLEPTDFFLPNYGWQKYVGLIARNSSFG